MSGMTAWHQGLIAPPAKQDTPVDGRRSVASVANDKSLLGHEPRQVNDDRDDREE